MKWITKTPLRKYMSSSSKPKHRRFTDTSMLWSCDLMCGDLQGNKHGEIPPLVT